MPSSRCFRTVGGASVLLEGVVLVLYGEINALTSKAELAPTHTLSVVAAIQSFQNLTVPLPSRREKTSTSTIYQNFGRAMRGNEFLIKVKRQ